MGKDQPLSTTRRVVFIGISVAVLAAVIFVGAAITAPKKSAENPAKGEVVTLQPDVEANKLAGQAEAAMSQNDTQTALDLASQALKLDAGNQTAATIVNRIQASKAAANTNSNSNSSDTGSKKPTADKYATKVKDITSLLPAGVDGWTTGQGTSAGTDALITFEPKKGTPAFGKVVRAVAAVHDMKTTAAAKNFIVKVDQRGYAEDKATVTVNTIKTAYFGTNGEAVAMVAFPRGRYAFEVALNVPAGGDPAAIKAIALQVASTLPASK